MDVEKILEEKGKLIEEEIEKTFPRNTRIPNLYDGVWYHMSTGGKRIRPVLAIMACNSLGGDINKIIPFAAACEVLHNWLLIHDDIEDGDRIRRDREAVWVKYGLPHGINIGDLMSQAVFKMILRSGERGVDEKTVFKLVNLMADTTIKTAEGQAMDINLRNSNNPTEDDYMRMVTGKTAYYMTAPIIGGAIVADADDEIINKIIEFGKYAGPAFQIADDILDLTVGKGRCETGRDIKEGKRSILIIHCLGKCEPEEKGKLLEILNKSPEETTAEDILYVKNLFEKYGSVDYARKRAEELVKKSKNVIKDLPQGLREVLEFFADYLIKRKK